MTAIRIPISERIANYSMPVPDGCVLWTGYVGARGYGVIVVDDHTLLAHRVSYELACGPIPDGLQLDHLCRQRSCVNPNHLEPVTSRENLSRSGVTIASRNAAKTHCPRGHAYDAENTKTYPGRGRYCRTCQATRRTIARGLPAVPVKTTGEQHDEHLYKAIRPHRGDGGRDHAR